jgi:lipoprotein
MKYISLLVLAALSLSACAEKPVVYPFRVVLLQSVPYTDTDMRRGSFIPTEINPTDGTPMPSIAFEGNGNFPLESEWDGSFNQHDTLSLNSSSDKVRLKLHVVYKGKPYIQSCDVALTANTMTSIKVVFDAADKLRCETVK